jgi:predicted O-linked N-acetylglucosamine transferase (SPINDLY family)
LTALGQHGEALVSLDRAIALAADFAQAHGHRADVLSALGRHAEAVDSYDRALALAPDVVEDWFNRGAALVDLGRYAEAVASFDRAIAGKPDFIDAHLRRAKALSDLDREHEALASIDGMLAREPNLPEAWLGRGNVLMKLRRREEAAAAFDRALELKADLAEAWLGRGNVLFDLERYRGAAAAYGKALAARPDLHNAASLRVLSKLYICDWTNLEDEIARLLKASRENPRSGGDFPLTAIPSSPADQIQLAKCYVRDRPAFSPMWRGEVYSHDRIRVAYLSADFHEHPNSYLATGLFERHDRTRFEVTGISFGPDVNSPLRRRIKGAFERFIDVHDKSDHDVADLVRGLEIDIAVDLMGFTKNNRLNVFARRPAPIQVNYLGYIGTMGADFIDYVIADKIALPHDQQAFFTEKIVHLPDCFLVTDDQQEIAPDTPSREEEGLPPEGFVFCSFNNSYKLGRPMFEVWMRLLHRVQGSVLWLAEGNPEMVVNLRREARQCGIEPERIVFAPRVGLPRHLGRQRLAGLFLDSTPYNAGATGAAALWAGIPLVTVVGETFVGRMAASMLHTAGLPELAVHSLGEYEALALKFACDPAFRSNIQRKLQDNLRTTPLFDTDRFRRNIEQAYATMIDILRRGESPRSFAVEPT